MANRIVQIGGSNSLFSAKDDQNNGHPATGIPVIVKVADEELLAYIQTHGVPISGILQVTQVDPLGTSLVITGPNSGAKGIRVYNSPTDPISDVSVGIDFPHHQVHEGESYSYCNLQTGGLNSGSNFDIRISVPVLTATTRTPHMVFELVSNGEAEMYLHRGVTWTSGGTAVSAAAAATAKDNRNHNSGNAAQTALYIGGGTALTVNGTGTVKYIWFTTTSKNQVGSNDRSTDEIDLSSNTEYMLRIISRTQGLKFLIRLSWYEDLGV